MAWACRPTTLRPSGSGRSRRRRPLRGRPATPALGSVFVTLNPAASLRPTAELHEWIRRDGEYAVLGTDVVVELNGGRSLISSITC